MMALKLLKNTESLMTISELAVNDAFTFATRPEFIQVAVQELVPDYPINLVCIDRDSLTAPAQELFHSLRARVLKTLPRDVSEVVVHA
ncbi:hypothetical protein D3C73_1121440 [compost metagenome]